MTKRRAGRVVTSFKNTGGSRYTQDRHTNITGLIAQTPCESRPSQNRTTHTAVTDARGAHDQVSRYLHKSRIRGLIMTLSLCLVPLYSRSLPAPAPALPVRHRGAASSAKNGATDSNDPSAGGTVLYASRHEILNHPSHRRCKRARRGTLQILLHAPCKGPAQRGAGVVSAGRLASSPSRSCTISRSSCRFQSRCTRPPPS